MKKTVVVGIATCLMFLCSSFQAYGENSLVRIEKTGTVRLGVRNDAKPFSYIDERGRHTGYSVDLCLETVKEIKEDLDNISLDVEWVKVNTVDRFDAISGGRIDILCESTTNTIERQSDMLFSYITYVTGTRLLVRRESQFYDLTDFEQRRIAVTRGTTSEDFLKRNNKIGSLGIIEYSVDNHAQALRELIGNNVDGFIADGILLDAYLRNPGFGEVLEIRGGHLSYEPYALAVPKQSIQLLDIINRTLARLFRTEKIWDIYTNYSTDLGNPTDLLRGVYLAQSLPSYPSSR